MEKIAILVDGGFYRKRAYHFWGDKGPEERADELMNYCYQHINAEGDSLYRIFYYDCLPMDKKVYHPLLKRTVDFKKTDAYSWANNFVDILKKRRRVAIRLGLLAESQAHYALKQDAVKDLCNGVRTAKDLVESDFVISVAQKGVDMKIGVDIASMAYKHQVSKMVLIAGDSDFVPAAKLARREGIDFVLDPMWLPIKPELSEHIDGLRSFRDCTENKARKAPSNKHRKARPAKVAKSAK